MSMSLPAMRALAASLLVACCATVSAEEGDPPEVTYPALPARGATPEAFVPAGWAIEMRAAGDLAPRPPRRRPPPRRTVARACRRRRAKGCRASNRPAPGA